MMSVVELLCAKIEPLRPGVGRVVRASDTPPGRATVPERKPSRKEGKERTRLAILTAIGSGCELRHEIAAEANVTVSTVDTHCQELVISRLITISKNKLTNIYKVTATGRLLLADIDES